MVSFLILATVLLSCLYLAVLVYFQNPKGRDNKLFVIMIFWLILWIIANYLENEPYSPEIKAFFLYADFMLAPVYSLFWFLFCYYFSEKNKTTSAVKSILLCLPVIVFALLLPLHLVIVNVDTQQEIIRFDPGVTYPIYCLLMIFYFGCGILSLYFKYRRFTGKEKIQILYIFIGFLLSSLVAATINLFFQEHLSVELFRLGTYAAIILVAFTSYAIIRHQLFDIRSFIQRGIIYLALVAVAIIVYLIIVSALGYFFRRLTDITAIFAAGISTVVGIFGVPPLEKYLRRKTDRIFYKDKYDYAEAMYKLSAVMNRNIELEKLLLAILDSLKEIIRVRHAYIILPREKLILDGQRQLVELPEALPASFVQAIERVKYPVLINADIPALRAKAKKNQADNDYIAALELTEKYGRQHNIEINTVILMDSKLIGILALGPKLSGDPYTGEDVKLLETLSRQAAVAIVKAQLFEKEKDAALLLEEKVKARTAEIQTMQEDQKRMMQDIAHSLQTPLTIIKAETDMMTDKPINVKKIKSFKRTLDRTSRFIYRVLHLARLEAGGQYMKKERIDLSGFLGEVVDDVSIIAGNDDIRVEHEIESGIYVIGDRKELWEMAMNLASNSIKYMRKDGNRVISLGLARRGDLAELEIEDTGIGMKPEQLACLFDRFYRAQDKGVIRSETKGTGLGLAICKQVVEKHGGTIRAESEYGQGTKFIVRLPVLK